MVEERTAALLNRLLQEHGAALQPEHHVVRCRAVDADGQPLAGLRLELLDQDPRTPPDLLGKPAITDAKGEATFRFARADFAEHPGDRGPDLVFRVFRGDALLEYTLPGIRNDKGLIRFVQPTDDVIELRVGLPPRPVPTPGARLDAATITRLGQDRVVAVEGVLGLFTSLGTGRETQPSADERANLSAIIDQLRREVTDLQARNLRLEGEVRILRERPAAPEDFAAGLQQSLDELQARMASMRNATSNVAVRQFRLEASVAVEISPLGRVGYRFLGPGERIAPEAISRLSLELVPLPRDTLAGVFTRDLFVPDRSLAALPDMPPALLDRLERAGLYSVGEY